MSTNDALRELVTTVCAADMLYAERAAECSEEGTADLLDRIIDQSINLYDRAMPIGVEHVDGRGFVTEARRKLAAVREELRSCGEAPRGSDVERALSATYVQGVGQISEPVMRKHLLRLHAAWHRTPA